MSDLFTTPLTFPDVSNKPFFFTSYVSTIDGKIYVKKPGYWPIGSRTDYDYFTFLRAHADVIVEGKNTALAFGKSTINTIHSEKFLSYRKMLGKEKQVEYLILSRNLNEKFAEVLKNEYLYKPTILTASDTSVNDSLANVSIIERLDFKKNENIVPSLVTYLTQKKYVMVFLDVGPLLLAEFIKASALDELFVTIAPRLYGTSKETVAIGNHDLFPSGNIPAFTIVSCEQIKDEVFIRYRNQKK